VLLLLPISRAGALSDRAARIDAAQDLQSKSGWPPPTPGGATAGYPARSTTSLHVYAPLS
jgi:hypothetical protein